MKRYIFLGYKAVHSVENQPTFRKNTSGPSSGSKTKPNKKTQNEAGIKQSLLTRYSSETSVDLHLTTQLYIPEDRTHYIHCENLKFCRIPDICRINRL
jgi:hypothetical protein